MLFSIYICETSLHTTRIKVTKRLLTEANVSQTGFRRRRATVAGAKRRVNHREKTKRCLNVTKQITIW